MRPFIVLHLIIVLVTSYQNKKPALNLSEAESNTSARLVYESLGNQSPFQTGEIFIIGKKNFTEPTIEEDPDGKFSSIDNVEKFMEDKKITNITNSENCQVHYIDFPMIVNITSPNYPANYGKNTFVCWKLVCSKAHRIGLKVVDFDIEYLYDKLILHDGEKLTSKKIKNVPPESKDSIYYSTGNVMTVSFETDESIQKKGFMLISFMDIVIEEENNLLNYTELIASSNQKNLTSPNYPDEYPASLDFRWLIKSNDVNRVIRFNCLYFQPNDFEVPSDFLVVHNGPSINSTILLHMNYNMRNCSAIYTSSQMALVRFHTNRMDWEFISDSRFVISYKTVPNIKACLTGEGLTVNAKNKSGKISSPTAVNGDNEVLNCLWKIKAPEGLNISLLFEKISIINGDWIGIWDNFDHLLLNVTNNHTNNQINFDVNEVSITFDSQYSINSGGFVLKYSLQQNGAVLTTHSKLIMFIIMCLSISNFL